VFIIQREREAFARLICGGRGAENKRDGRIPNALFLPLNLKQISLWSISSGL
jgi:hypothetical protein